MKKPKVHQKELSQKFMDLGLDVYEQLEQKEFPKLAIPSRSTSNIKYSSKLRHFVLGEKEVIRSASNIRHLKPFTQTIWVAYFVHRLLKANRSSTLRDIYYSAEADDISFKDQEESDGIITDLEALLRIPREDFKVFPEERSAIFGDLTVEYTIPGYEGNTLNLSSSPDGIMIGPALTTSNLVKCRADKVIAIESGGMFTRLIEEQAHKKFNALLIHTAGQAPRSTRRLIRRLNNELELPILVFTDGDPWGCHIAMVIISGSANAAHIPDLATPEAIWMGVWATDIDRYALPTESFNEHDKKRVSELLHDPRYQSKFWKKQLKKFKELKRKAEQQAFSKYGLGYVVESYIPEKLETLRKMKLLD
ncbi:MAG: DNA topoisomerase IV subunit A [Candidatus Hodarchaeota archaeon]